MAFLAALLLLPAAGQARNRQGEKLLKQGQEAEARQEYDRALELYERAVASDPRDAAYRLALHRVRFQAGQKHVAEGRKLRENGNLEGALSEFQKAFAIDPSSSIAESELRRTYRMIRDKETQKEQGEPNQILTPAERVQKELEERIASLAPAPELKPVNPAPINVKINNQPARVLYETVCKLAGINLVRDPDAQVTNTLNSPNHNLDLVNVSLEDALDIIAVMTRTYWKPLSENTILVTLENPTKRRDFEDLVTKVYYLKNITTPQELTELTTAVRGATDARRLFNYTALNAFVIRGTRDQVALADKIVADFDKPKAEVVVDFLVMEVTKGKARELAATLMSGSTPGLSLTPSFSPRGGVTTGESGSSSASTAIRLNNLSSVGAGDWVVTLPNYLFSAIMSSSQARLIQSPQLRASDGQKSLLRLGDRIPYATGSFQPGVGTVGVSPLVSTQFSYADVGVNVDMTPKIHNEKEISLALEIEVSNESGRVNIGGIDQPIISQRRISHTIRVREGEVTLIGGLMRDQDKSSSAGLPLLGEIPLFGNLFSQRKRDRQEAEWLLALIPHVVRATEFNPENLRAVDTGPDQALRVRYQRPAHSEAAAPAPPGSGSQSSPEAPPPTSGATAPNQPKPAETATERPEPQVSSGLSFVPPLMQISEQGEATVQLVANNISDLFMAPMRISYDPKVVSLVEAQQGPFLASDGNPVTFTPYNDPESGVLTVRINRFPGAGGISGSGPLFTLRFKALTKGVSPVRVTELTLRDSRLQQINATPPAAQITVQ